MSASRLALVGAAAAVAVAALAIFALPGGTSDGPPAAHSATATPERVRRTVQPRVPLQRLPRAALLLDAHGGRAIWAYRPTEKLRIASLTKIMTALIVAEKARPGEEVEIVPDALHVGGSRVGDMPVGGELPVETLLYGMLLPSGNDAANELAVHVAGSIPAFVAMMNERARRFGLRCTHYAAPSGFFNQDNYSCARDLAILATRILRSRRLSRIVGTAQITLPYPDPRGQITLTNTNPLLIYRYPGTIGVKTGWTREAGDCLVAAARRGGVTLIAVLLHSRSPGRQARKLFDWAFTRLYRERPVRSPAIPDGA